MEKVNVFFNIQDNKYKDVNKQIKLDKSSNIGELLGYIQNKSGVSLEEIVLVTEDAQYTKDDSNILLKECIKSSKLTIKFDLIIVKPSKKTKITSKKDKEEIQEEKTEEKEKLDPNSKLIPNEFICPISKEILFDALTINVCGHSFAKDALIQYIKVTKQSGKTITCPFCGGDASDISIISPENRKEIYNYVMDNIVADYAKDYKKKYMIYQKDQLHKSAFKNSCKDVGIRDAISTLNYPEFLKDPTVWFYKNESNICLLSLDLTIQYNNYIKSGDTDIKFVILGSRYILDVKTLKLFDQIEDSISELTPFTGSLTLIDKTINDDFQSFVSCVLEGCIKYNFTNVFLPFLGTTLELDLTRLDSKNIQIIDAIVGKPSNKLFKNDSKPISKESSKSFGTRSGFNKWQFKLGKGWSDFDKADSIQMEKAFGQNLQKFKMQIRGNLYEIDFSKMIQVNISTGTRRSIQRFFVKY